ncbi:permease prefix domain 1-containing protein [Kineosporia babensis]|uniref:Permease prefix domain 1-containing protein n=1 Tax=Kineosporia babensis TaxID=499548 RepID=A0A9X1SYR5_9ACTN|nr:permease prefix domain 1-containing protein [Kineosporia babensis]
MSYLGELDAALTGPRRLKRDLLQEAADHLDDATEALVEAGHAPSEARARAESDFGPVAEVADAYAGTLAVASARRTVGLLLFVLSFQPFLWDKGVNFGKMFSKESPDTWWYAVLDLSMEIGGGIALFGAALALVVTGLGGRWFPVGRRTARAAAFFTVAAAVFVPLNASVMLVSDGVQPQLWGLAALLMVMPLAITVVSAWGTIASARTVVSEPEAVRQQV